MLLSTKVGAAGYLVRISFYKKHYHNKNRRNRYCDLRVYFGVCSVS